MYQTSVFLQYKFTAEFVISSNYSKLHIVLAIYTSCEDCFMHELSPIPNAE